MKTTLNRAQLSASLTVYQINNADQDSTFEDVSPVDEAMESACALVDYYLGDADVAPSLSTGWARDIAAYKISTRLGTSSDDLKKAYDDALAILKDGKETGFTAASQSTITAGGATRINTSKF